jgi:hypothetical protein
MNGKLLRLAQRRESLILESEKQRTQLTQAVDAWRGPLEMADKGLAVIDTIKKHPIWLAGGSAILLKLIRPSRIGKWFSRGLVAWQILRRFQNKLS